MVARRSRRPVAVGDVVARLLDDKPGAGDLTGSTAGAGRVSRILSAFGRIGPPITDHADAADYRRGVLTLQVHDSSWLTELTFLRKEIQDRVNRMVGGEPVKEVRLRLGPRRPARPPEPPPRALTAEEQQTVEAWSAPIADEHVREAVRRAAARSLSRGPIAIPPVSGPPGPRITPSEGNPEPMKYGFGAGQGDQRAGWIKDRWKARGHRSRE